MSIVKNISGKLKKNSKSILLVMCILGLLATSIVILIWLWPYIKVFAAILFIGFFAGGVTKR